MERPLAIKAMPRWLQTVPSPFVPVLGEMKEMRFQWDAPYLVDSAKLEARFWSDPTPFERGIEQTLEAYREAAR